jgi:prolipoprotein diacylglyceryl transferase
MHLSSPPLYSYFHLTLSPIAFTVPFFGLEIRWYGLLFACGFYLAYQVLVRLLQPTTSTYSEKLLLYLFFGVVVGARIGHVLFYDFDYYLQEPSEIVALWHGGLASHGGVLGVLLALYLFTRRHREHSFLDLLDKLAVVAPLLGGFIRIGNFLNQEIVGKFTSLPWGVVFTQPLEAGVSSSLPLHPVQLYESVFYFFLFGLFYYLRTSCWQPGSKAASLLSLLFLGRFFLENLKDSPSLIRINQPLISIELTAGQLLSLPFIILPIVVLGILWKCKKS